MDKLIKITTDEQGSQVVSARELHGFLEVKAEFTTWFKRMIEYGFEVNQDFTSFDKIVKREKGATTLKEFAITLDMAKELSMIQRSDKGRLARKYFIDCEKKLKEVLPASYLISDPIKRAEAWIIEQKELQVAIATKAEIGSRREATAMATASVQTRRANKLQIELDESKEYCTIKRMQLLNHGQKFNWRLLKSTGIEMGVPTKRVFDSNYGTVCSYHKSVWKETYNLTF